MNPSPVPGAERAALARDLGLRKVSRVTRRLLAAAVGLSGALALVAASAVHGRSTTHNGAAPPATQSSTSSSSTAASSPAAPQEPPVQTQAPPVVVSGGS